MKLILSLLFFALPTLLFANNSQNKDTLIFNKRITRVKDHWIVFPKDQSGKYAYGFVYMDPVAGFTFQLTGNFTINGNNHFINDTVLQKSFSEHSVKIRLQPNTKLSAELPQSHFAELGIKPVPDWLSIYNSVSDSLKYNVILGRHLNSMNDCEYAITVLLKTYKVQPHAKGLEFELAYAYNVLRRFDDAITVLQSAIKNNPDDVFFYKEMGYSYLEKKEIDKAIEIFKKGIAACKTDVNNEKAEMALNIAAGYRYQKNDTLCKEWELKAKEWAPKGSQTYNLLLKNGIIDKSQSN